MIRKIIKSIRRVKQAAYLATLRKQLDRLDRDYSRAEGPDRRDLATRIGAKQAAIGRAQQALAALAVALCIIPAGCAHAPTPTGAIETAVVISEAALEVCRAKHRSDAWDGSQGARDARERCLQVQDIERTRDATTALDDAVEAMAAWVRTGA